jgi:hypothetical protein
MPTTANTNSRIDVFLNSSALFADVAATGAARALFLLKDAGQTTITVSEQVITETARAFARHTPLFSRVTA